MTQASDAFTTTQAYVDVATVATHYGVSVATIWRRVRNGELPPPMKFSTRCSKWKMATLLAFDAANDAAFNCAGELSALRTSYHLPVSLRDQACGDPGACGFEAEARAG